MDLWIRSQDKEVLGQFKNLCIDENIGGDIVILGSDGHIHVNDKVTSAFELGIYESKERALEVLDEVQDLLSPKINVNTFNIKNEDMLNGSQYSIFENNIKDFSIKQYETYVYEMPEN